MENKNLKIEKNKIYLMDCMQLMKAFPDGYFDLILTDPPYAHGKQIISSTQQDHYNSDWDKPISQECINEMLRISKNQIIFGAEHLSFMLPKSRGWIVWDKRLTAQESNDFSDCEIIWTSFDKPARIIRYLWNGFRVKMKEKRYKHPTQKPLALIMSLIKANSKENALICDPFMGSGTTAVACKHLKRFYIGCDNNEDYVKIANDRLKQEDLLKWS